ncbi:MAG: hypothetical protein HY072_00200 [Deltaproteobacteria bacterium]|nr:hypothetical protein [Deltaproteobacteria bacterium]
MHIRKNFLIDSNSVFKVFKNFHFRFGVFLCLLTVLYLFSIHYISSHKNANFSTPQWDGAHYVSILEHGYSMNPCGAALESRGIKLCGNPWFPGWPYFLRFFTNGLAWIGLTSVQWITGMSMVIFLLTIITLSMQSQILLKPFMSQTKQIGIWASLWMFVQPGSFYYLTAFPYIFTVFLLFCSLLLIQHPKTHTKPVFQRLSDLFAFWASFSYPTAICGVLLDIPSRAKILSGSGFKKLLWRGFIYSLGILMVSTIFKVLFDNFWLYFEHHAQYPRTEGSPFNVIYGLITGGHENERLTFLWYGFGLLVITLKLPNIFKMRSFWFINAIYFFTFFNDSWISIYRYYLLMFPMGALLGATPVSSWLKIVYFILGLSLQLAKFLPSYVSGNLV